MDIELIREFQYIAKNGSLTAAATELNTTQSTLSKHLRALERELGATLLERKSGATGIRLTPAGELFFEAGMQIANIYTRMKGAVARASRTNPRTISVDASMRKAFFPLVSLAKERCRDELLPAIQWASASPYSISFDRLRKGEVDIVLEPDPVIIDMSDLASYRLYIEPAFLVVHQHDSHADMEKAEVNDLLSLEFLSLLNQSAFSTRKVLDAIGLAHGMNFAFTMLPYDSNTIMLSERLEPGKAMLIPQSCIPLYRNLIPYARFIELGTPGCAFDMRAWTRPGCDRDTEAIVHVLIETASMLGPR